jgi:hypothetical protein
MPISETELPVEQPTKMDLMILVHGGATPNVGIQPPALRAGADTGR